MIEWFEVMAASLTALFPIVNPIGAIPTFLVMTGNNTAQERNRQLLKACVYVFFILTVFLIAGNLIMTFFGITMPGIRIAGGILLSRMSLVMLRAEPKYKQSPEEVEESIAKSDISFTPLAMPMLSGPGSIAVTLGLTPMADHWYDYLAILLGILMVTVSCWLILHASTRILKFMGVSGMNAMTRMMGFMTLCVGVQFIINGVIAIVTDPQLLEKLFAAFKTVNS